MTNSLGPLLNLQTRLRRWSGMSKNKVPLLFQLRLTRTNLQNIVELLASLFKHVCTRTI